ncbi:hypothetical protein LINPERHAP2_LOCUS14768 [Linum perenne]
MNTKGSKTNASPYLRPPVAAAPPRACLSDRRCRHRSTSAAVDTRPPLSIRVRLVAAITVAGPVTPPLLSRRRR